MKIVIGSDHAGFEYKQSIVQALKQSFDIEDVGPESSESVDYPDYAHKVAQAIDSEAFGCGILLCGSGNGVCMAANKHARVRAALCWTVEIARLARQHNNANIICIPARFVDVDLAIEMVHTFINEPFEGGRHQRRVDKICL